MTSNPPDPKARTSRKPFTVDGVPFATYRVGVLEYATISDDGRICVMRNSGAQTYHASVDGKSPGKRFRSEHSALVVAVKMMRQADKV